MSEKTNDTLNNPETILDEGEEKEEAPSLSIIVDDSLKEKPQTKQPTSDARSGRMVIDRDSVLQMCKICEKFIVKEHLSKHTAYCLTDSSRYFQKSVKTEVTGKNPSFLIENRNETENSFLSNVEKKMENISLSSATIPNAEKKTETLSIEKQKCPVCEKEFTEFEIYQHVESCLKEPNQVIFENNNNNDSSNINSYNKSMNSNIKTEFIPKTKKQTVVTCPLCNKRFPEGVIDSHLKSCLESQSYKNPFFCKFENAKEILSNRKNSLSTSDLFTLYELRNRANFSLSLDKLPSISDIFRKFSEDWMDRIMIRKRVMLLIIEVMMKRKNESLFLFQFYQSLINDKEISFTEKDYLVKEMIKVFVSRGCNFSTLLISKSYFESQMKKEEREKIICYPDIYDEFICLFVSQMEYITLEEIVFLYEISEKTKKFKLLFEENQSKIINKDNFSQIYQNFTHPTNSTDEKLKNHYYQQIKSKCEKMCLVLSLDQLIVCLDEQKINIVTRDAITQLWTENMQKEIDEKKKKENARIEKEKKDQDVHGYGYDDLDDALDIMDNYDEEDEDDEDGDVDDDNDDDEKDVEKDVEK